MPTEATLLTPEPTHDCEVRPRRSPDSELAKSCQTRQMLPLADQSFPIGRHGQCIDASRELQPRCGKRRRSTWKSAKSVVVSHGGAPPSCSSRPTHRWFTNEISIHVRSHANRQCEDRKEVGGWVMRRTSRCVRVRLVDGCSLAGGVSAERGNRLCQAREGDALRGFQFWRK